MSTADQVTVEISADQVYTVTAPKTDVSVLVFGGETSSRGASAYEIAVANGFVGSQAEWLLSLKSHEPGQAGASAYQLAVAHGFVGTEEEWLASLTTQVPQAERSDRMALDLYSLGISSIVVGPKVVGSDPPQRGAAVDEKINHLLGLGIPEDFILWLPTGEEGATLQLDNVAMFSAATWSEPAISAVTNGTIAVESMIVQPTTDTPSIVQVGNGEIGAESALISPAFTEPTLIDPSIPLLVPENLNCAISFTAPALTATPSDGTVATINFVSAVTLTEPTVSQVGNGTLVADSMSTQPTTTSPTVSQVSNGVIAAGNAISNATFIEPTVTPTSGTVLSSESMTAQSMLVEPSLTQVSNGSLVAETMTAATSIVSPSMTEAVAASYSEDFEGRTLYSLLSSFGWGAGLGGGAAVFPALNGKCAAISADQEQGIFEDYSEISVTAGTGNITFVWKSDTAVGYFYLDGVQKATIASPSTATPVTVAVDTAGSHTLRWRVTTTSAGILYFDDIVVP